MVEPLSLSLPLSRQELDKCRIDLQAPEVQQYLKQEIQRREEIHRTELNHQQEKCVFTGSEREARKLVAHEYRLLDSLVQI